MFHARTWAAIIHVDAHWLISPRTYATIVYLYTYSHRVICPRIYAATIHLTYAHRVICPGAYAH